MTVRLVCVSLAVVIFIQNGNCLRDYEDLLIEQLQPLQHDLEQKISSIPLLGVKKTKQTTNADGIYEKDLSGDNVIEDPIIIKDVENTVKYPTSRLTPMRKRRVARQTHSGNSYLYPQLNTPSPYVNPYSGNSYPTSQSGYHNHTQPSYWNKPVKPIYNNNSQPTNYPSSSQRPNSFVQSFNGSRAQQNNFYGPGQNAYPSHTQGQYPTRQNFTNFYPGNKPYNTPNSSPSSGQYPTHHFFNRSAPGLTNSSTTYPHSQRQHPSSNFNTAMPGSNNPYGNSYPGYSSHVQGHPQQYPSNNSGFSSGQRNNYPNVHPSGVNASHSQGQYPYKSFNYSSPGQTNNPYGNSYPGHSAYSQVQYSPNNNFNSSVAQHNSNIFPGGSNTSHSHPNYPHNYNTVKPGPNNSYGSSYPQYPSPSGFVPARNNSDGSLPPGYPNKNFSTQPSNGQQQPYRNPYSGYTPQNNYPGYQNFDGYNTAPNNTPQGQNWTPTQPYNSNLPYQSHDDHESNYFHYPTNYNTTGFDPRKVDQRNF